MKKNIILELSQVFAKDMVRYYMHIVKTEKEYVISKQLLRSSTSIAANITEAQSASSKKDFINKLSISLKEARETLYWLELINDTKIYKDTGISDYLSDCEKIIGTLVKIINSTKKNMH